jgi:aspartate kinase
VRPSKTSAVEVVERLQAMEALSIDAVTLDDTQARLTIANVADQPGIAAAIFQAVAKAEIFVDMIVQSAGHDGKANLSFTVPTRQESQCRALLEQIAAQRNCGPVSSSKQIAKLSIVGIGMRSHTEVAIRAFECLARLGINIAMINTSEVRVNIVVDGAKGEAALAGLRDAFADAM